MNTPIGIFDSGLGGLTVFREIHHLLPQENLVYVGDTARVPYGVKSPETVKRYAYEIAQFLRAHQVKAIVIACNTASALALTQLQDSFDIPIIGVVEPGVRAALQVSKSCNIGVIGTEATIRSESYPRTLLQCNSRVQVFTQACPLFVPLVEEGWTQHEVTKQIAEIYLKDWHNQPLDTIILACTHYPLLKEVLQTVMGNSITLVDSAQETARALQDLLKKKNILNSSTSPGAQTFYTTDAPEKMQQHAMKFLGTEPQAVSFTDLNPNSLSKRA